LRVEQLHQALFINPFNLLLKQVAAEDEEEAAKLRAEAGKIGILALVAANMDASVLPRLAPAPVPVPAAVDMPNT
jgi:hypothetical protein